MYIVVGLGNPGDKYKNTRHNIGFITVDYFADKHSIKLNKVKHKAIWGDGFIGGEKVILAKPQTYMNLSGESVQELMSFYKVEASKLIVIYDDIDLPVGKVRIRPSGSSGTHNGMKSIIYLINTQEFPRIRIGIDKQPEYMDLGDYVLGGFSKDDVPQMEEAVKKASQAIEEIIKSGINTAMNKYNK